MAGIQHDNRIPVIREGPWVCYVHTEFSIYFFILMFFGLSNAHLALRDTNDWILRMDKNSLWLRANICSIVRK